MKWYQKMYLGENIKPHYRKYRKRIQNKKIVAGVYFILLSDNPSNLMEIVTSGMLLEEEERQRDRKIIGMAMGKAEALEIVQKIVKEMYDATGGFCIKEYLQSR